jgi:hypothetical protein
MKIKILVAPLLIVAIIVLLIWFIYPLWTNGSDGIKEKLDSYKIQKDRQAELEKKKEKISTRFQEIESKKNQVDLLYRFLPETMSEEELIDKMQFLASMKQEDAANGWEMGPVKMSVTLSKAIAPIASAEPAATAGQNNAAVLIKKDLTNFDLNFQFLGPYERVRDIVKSINSLKRYNRITKYKATSGIIKREGNVLKWEEPKGEPANGLKVEMTMNYNYFNTGSVGPENINDPVFSLDKLEKEIRWDIVDIIQKKESDIVPLTLSQSGRGNPFVLPSQ